MGRNKIGHIPKTIAEYHTTMLKQLGGWKSAGVAEGTAFIY